MQDSLGDRMKAYENVGRNYLTKRLPVVVRVDGHHFHSITKRHFVKGYSDAFFEYMSLTAAYAQGIAQNCRLAYSQSDEITFLLADYRTINTNAWFDNNKSKIETIFASACAAKFSLLLGSPVQFDARAFTVPPDDVVNCFLWRQQDATRNAIQMVGQQHFSPKQLNGKSCNDIQEMLFQEKSINFNDLPARQRRGFCVIDGSVDTEIPIFSQNRDYIQRFVDVRED